MNPLMSRFAFTDHGGKPVHVDCYARMIRRRQITQEKWRRLARGQRIPFLSFQLVMRSRTRLAGWLGRSQGGIG
jgi:hypothetical protein